MQSGTNTGQTLSESSKTEKLLDIKNISQEIFQLDTLYHLAQTSHLCPGLGDTLTQFLHAAPDQAPHILSLAEQIVTQALIMGDQSEGPNKTFRNLAPIAHLMPLPACAQAEQKPIPLSSLTMIAK
jgi:hypothetical protein